VSTAQHAFVACYLGMERTFFIRRIILDGNIKYDMIEAVDCIEIA
jgi:hypothetical protein